ncbi:Uncharacterized protein PBTT_06853 [Plasmodiophora brassicae]|uniref:Uncharacterized protein n=1 Tax=Plasmodiophora brassicae TaxID=37360 RepID=A0A0G4J8K1_PLABS|nr:hypothetical protein PBRA_003517 [Plasmodiophora brassicae]
MMKVLKKALTALKKKAAKAVKQVARHLRRRRPANPGASTKVATVDGAGRPVVLRSPEPHSSVDLPLPWATTTSGSWINEAAAVTPILISVQVCPLLYGTFGACQPCHTPSWYASQLDRIMNADHVVPIYTLTIVLETTDRPHHVETPPATCSPGLYDDALGTQSTSPFDVLDRGPGAPVVVEWNGTGGRSTLNLHQSNTRHHGAPFLQ